MSDASIPSGQGWAESAAAPAGFSERHKSSWQREMMSLTGVAQACKRVVQLEARIWLVRAKAKAMRLAVGAACFAAALVLALMALVWFYVGCFHILTDVLHIPPVWAYLIFAGVHVICAGVLMWVGMSMFRARKRPAGGGAGHVV